MISWSILHIFLHLTISGWLITCIAHNINLSFTDRIPQPELQKSNSEKQFHSKLLRKETFRKWLCLELCKGSGEVLNKKRKMIGYFVKKKKKIDCTLAVFNFMYMYMISSNDQYSIMQVTKVHLVIIIVSQ